MSTVDMSINQSQASQRGIFHDQNGGLASGYNFTVLYWFLSLSLMGLVLRFVGKNYDEFLPSKTAGITRYPKFIQRLLYLVWGPRILDDAYFAANGKSFKIPTPGHDLCVVSTPELVQEIKENSSRQLSLNGIAKDLLQPQFTIPAHEWLDQRTHSQGHSSGYVRAIQTLLTSHLPQFQPQIEKIIKQAFEFEFKQAGGPNAEGWHDVKIFGLMKRTITKLNTYIFFGEELGQNPLFTAAALDFPQSTFIAAELLRCLPSSLCPLGLNIITRNRWAEKVMMSYLVPIVQARLDAGATGQDHADVMQWLIDSSPKKNPWTAAEIVGQILTLWFAGVFQPAIVGSYALIDLADHFSDGDGQGLVDELMSEVRNGLPRGDGKRDVEKLEVLDSFLRESIRVNNSDAVSGRRKAMEPFAFSDGLEVQKGDWVCFPMWPMMRDPARYEDPKRFDGFRFIKANQMLRRGQNPKTVPERTEMKFTDAGYDWPIWGFGRETCPGRWYASLVMKLLLVHVLENYECKMAEPKETRSRWSWPRYFFWRTGVVPSSRTVVQFRKLQQ
ncbi:cytochrome P450 [Rhypophila decipiens]